MDENKKIIFGLSPVSTFVNSIILFVISQIIWVIRFAQQIPANTKDLKSLNIDVEWYWDIPVQMFALFMMWRWVEFKYELNFSDFNWKTIRYKYIYTVFLFWLASIIIKSNLLLFFLPK